MNKNLYKEYFKFPLELDKESIFKVMTADGHMAFDFNFALMHTEDNFMQILIDLANNPESHKLTTFSNAKFNTFDSNLYFQDEQIASIRSWGRFVGQLELSDEKALEIQESFANYLVDVWNNSLEYDTK